MRMWILPRHGAGHGYQRSRLVHAHVRHRSARIMPFQHLCKAGAIIFAGKHGIDGPLQHRPAQPAHEVAMQLAIVVVMRQRARRHAARGAQGGQARIVQHDDVRLRELPPQPGFPARRRAAGKFRLGVADHQQFFAGVLRTMEQQFVALVQRAKFADHEAALVKVHAAASCKSEVY
ncbi:hypothetical protein D3C72_1673630 [compost metagenome]